MIDADALTPEALRRRDLKLTRRSETTHPHTHTWRVLQAEQKDGSVVSRGSDGRSNAACSPAIHHDIRRVHLHTWTGRATRGESTLHLFLMPKKPRASISSSYNARVRQHR